MAEYFVPISSINVIRLVFWGEFYITNKLSKCQMPSIIILMVLSVSMHIWTLFSGILAQIYVHNTYKIHPKRHCFVISMCMIIYIRLLQT